MNNNFIIVGKNPKLYLCRGSGKEEISKLYLCGYHYFQGSWEGRTSETLNFNGMGTIRIVYRMGWLWTTSLKSCPVRFPLNVFFFVFCLETRMEFISSWVLEGEKIWSFTWEGSWIIRSLWICMLGYNHIMWISYDTFVVSHITGQPWGWERVHRRNCRQRWWGAMRYGHDVRIWLSQWPTFKLLGTTYLVGNKSLNFYFMVLWLSKGYMLFILGSHFLNSCL